MVTFRALGAGAPVLAAVDPGPDLGAAGYAETEYVARGRARSYGPDPEADYATRVLVRAPRAAADFSGVVVAEWLNVSSGADAAPDYTYLGAEIVRRGHAWVGVSAQLVGVEGGPPSVGGPPSAGLRGTDPDRYGELAHPGDCYGYDIFREVAAAVGGPAAPLAGHPVARRVAVGESQSAFALTTFLNVVAATGPRVFDGYLVHSRGRAGLGLGTAGLPADLASVRGGAPERIRDDLTVPVITVQTETDVLSPRFGYVDARQEDGPWFRLWEVAGTAHADRWQIGDLEDLLGCPEPVNRGQQAYVLRAALRALESWDAPDAGPPSADRLAVDATDPPCFVEDAAGNVRGGVRTPVVDAPAQVLTGLAGPGTPVLCSLFGATRDLPREALRARYPSVGDYTAAYEEATDRAIAAGFLLPEDRAAVLAEARADLIALAYRPT